MNESRSWSSRCLALFAIAALTGACVAIGPSVFADPPKQEEPEVVFEVVPTEPARLAWTQEEIDKNGELADEVSRHMKKGELGRAAEAWRAQNVFVMQTDINMLRRECQRLAAEVEVLKAEIAASKNPKVGGR